MHKPASRWQRKSLFLLGNGVSHQKLKMPHMLQDMLQHMLSILRQDEISQGNLFLSEGIRSCSQDEGKQGFQNICIFPQKDWPRQDSNLQSPVPKSGALSIRPHGLIPVDCSSLTHRKYIKQMGLQYTEDSLMERLASRWLWERWPCLFFLGKGVLDASYIARYVANPL